MKKLLRNKKDTKNNGITLIALVVTIVVLLILAGVTITAVLGQDGIIEKAKEAAEKTKNAVNSTEQDMADLLNLIDKYSKEDSPTTPGPTPATFSPDTIKKQAKDFYGKTVNYTSTNSTGVTKWRIFYAGKIDDGDVSEQDHIYLIADDYISKDNAPEKDGQKLTEVGGRECTLSFSDELLNCYPSGASDIYNNSKVKNLLKKYFDYTEDNSNYPNRTSVNPNIKAVAYMLDTEIWSAKYGDGGKSAEYAIGGPTLEMFVKSYNETHSESSISCEVTGTNGYTVSYSGQLETDYDLIYSIINNSNAIGWWIASPLDEGADILVTNFASYFEGTSFEGSTTWDVLHIVYTGCVRIPPSGLSKIGG